MIRYCSFDQLYHQYWLIWLELNEGILLIRSTGFFLCSTSLWLTVKRETEKTLWINFGRRNVAFLHSHVLHSLEHITWRNSRTWYTFFRSFTWNTNAKIYFSHNRCNQLLLLFLYLNFLFVAVIMVLFE